MPCAIRGPRDDMLRVDFEGIDAPGCVLHNHFQYHADDALTCVLTTKLAGSIIWLAHVPGHVVVA